VGGFLIFFLLLDSDYLRIRLLLGLSLDDALLDDRIATLQNDFCDYTLKQLS
jgi:hypothetical protein